ncbi:MAG: hypothetical protein LC803_08350 [Acidobacteria bacterium]|nr:hypothetical protein [Acidobacteriota bacterium]
MQLDSCFLRIILIIAAPLLISGIAYLLYGYYKGRRKKRNESPLAYAPTEARSYLDHLFGEYALIPENSISEQYKREAEALKNTKIEALTWDQLLKLELILIEIMPVERLISKVWVTRTRFRDAAGAVVYKEYLGTQPPFPKLGPPVASPPSADEADALVVASPPEDSYPYNISFEEERALRGDLQTILQDTFWRFRIRTAWEERRNWFAKAFVTIYVVLVGVGLGLIIALIYLPDRCSDKLHPMFTLVAVTMMGALGGFVSMLQRLQSLPSGGQRNENLIEMVYGRDSILSQSLLSGASFSLVLLFIFLGGLLRGGLFPDYPDQDGATFIHLLRTVALDGTQFAKLLVWSFIAGFAERFVPDFLDRFTAKEKARDANADA